MLPRKQTQERGQILLLVAVALVGLLAFTALAMDGGMVYAERRHAQNAADAAALAGAVEIAKGNSNSTAVLAAQNSVVTNGYAADDPASEVDVNITNSTIDVMGEVVLVQVNISSTTTTSLAHMFGRSSITNDVTATARVRKPGPVMPNTAIVALGNCKGSGGPTHLVSSQGGGTSGGILAYNGGIFLNTKEPAGNAHCSMDPPNGNNAWGIRAFNGHKIYSVGSHTYNGEPDIAPVPIVTGVNNGVPIDDPFAFLDEPTCPNVGTVSGSGEDTVYTPGRFGGGGEPSLGEGTLSPGIYCISSGFSLSGNPGTKLKGTGVVLYLASGPMTFTGNGMLEISAPTAANCTGNHGETYESCTYKGMAIFSARSNTNTLDFRGNGDGSKITGTIYALNGTFGAKGGGNSADEWVVKGQLFAESVEGNGGGSFVVYYDENSTLWGPADMGLFR